MQDLEANSNGSKANTSSEGNHCTPSSFILELQKFCLSVSWRLGGIESRTAEEFDAHFRSSKHYFSRQLLALCSSSIASESVTASVARSST